MTIRVAIVKFGDEVSVQPTRSKTMEELQQYFHDEESEEVVISLETFESEPKDENHAILEAILYAGSLPESIGVDFERLLNLAFSLGREYQRENPPGACQTTRPRGQYFITVPDLSADELFKLAQEKLGLKSFELDNFIVSENEKMRLIRDGRIVDFTEWDFISDERGKTYEVQMWKPGCATAPGFQVHNHFTDGFVGNTAAFIAWVTKNDPEGYHASIPERDRLFKSGEYRHSAPQFIRVSTNRKLLMCSDVHSVWSSDWCYVAFREVK